MNFWLIQLIGLLGNLILIAALQFNHRKLVVAAQGTACILWGIHFALLDAPTAAFINIVSFVRSVVFYFNDRRWAQSRWIFWGFIALFAANSLLTWEGWQSLLPGIGMCATTVALWTKSTRTMRYAYLCSSPPWLAYDLLSGSYACALMESIGLVSYIVAVLRFDRISKRYRKERTAEETGQPCRNPAAQTGTTNDFAEGEIQ